MGIEVPSNIEKVALSEAFFLYVKNDYYGWLKDNVKSLLNHGEPDLKCIKKGMEH